jgi:hypothetical protein
MADRGDAAAESRQPGSELLSFIAPTQCQRSVTARASVGVLGNETGGPVRVTPWIGLTGGADPPGANPDLEKAVACGQLDDRQWCP